MECEPSLDDVQKVLCCPRTDERCEGPCHLSEAFFRSAIAVRKLYRDHASEATNSKPPEAAKPAKAP